MALSIQQLDDDSKLSHALRFEVLEQLCPPELVSELLSRSHAWGKRERSLNQLLVVYYVIALSLCASAQSSGGLRSSGEWVALAVAEPVAAPADGSSAGVSTATTGWPHHAAPVSTSLPTYGDGADQGSLSLRFAAHGH